MDLNSIGNMNINLRNLEMKSMWDMRKRNKDYDSKGQQRLDQMFESMYGANTEETNGTDKKLTGIMQKYYNGSKLTTEEREYLRVKNPQAYNELVAEEQEQKAYEQELRRCKTKEEVKRVKMTHLGQSLSTVNEVKNNPHIPKEKKLEWIAREKRRTDNINESTQKFIESGRYAKLPTEAEKALAEKKKAEREKLKAEAVKEAAKENTEAIFQTPEQNEPTDRPKTDRTNEIPKTEESKSMESKADTDLTKPDSVLPEAERHTESAEERKVRRAKARAAYTAAAADFAPKNSTIQTKA